MKITNPVLTGFHADPSMIRVKDTYYIANSTFEWFPGIRLHESKDMVHWNTLPYPLGAEQLDMRGDPASGGVWAPDLSYADGRFWIVYSDVHIVNGAFKDVVNYLTTAEDIRGPWSKPLRLNGVGFDASLFHDDDGRKYLVQQTWDHREYKHQFHGITLTEFDTATMRLKPETARTIWMGDDVKLVEGPHLYKINGWYYLFCAEGGTVWTHQESVARSRTLDELSFEASPTNPFITNFDIPGSYLQKQGHGALVDTPSGEWYYASLCGRPWHHETESFTDPRGWCTLGRETSIQKVEWAEDGWPYIVGGHGGERYVEAPKDAIETVAPASRDQHDEFDADVLGLDWNTLRVPFDEKMGSVGGGSLKLIGQGSLCNTFDLSLVARRMSTSATTGTSIPTPTAPPATSGWTACGTASCPSCAMRMRVCSVSSSNTTAPASTRSTARRWTRPCCTRSASSPPPPRARSPRCTRRSRTRSTTRSAGCACCGTPRSAPARAATTTTSSTPSRSWRWRGNTAPGEVPTDLNPSVAGPFRSMGSEQG